MEVTPVEQTPNVIIQHDCKHEVGLALMKSSLQRIERNVDDICHILRGNGEIGLKGKTERHWVAIKTLFWINGATALVLVTSILEHIFRR